jgi:hypothetical protein
MFAFRPLLAALMLLPFALGTTAAMAQGGFLDRGRDLLKGLGGSAQPGAAGLADSEIASGLREALRVGSERVVATLGRDGGFNKSPDVHIPLPPTLKSVQNALSRVGMSGIADDLELRLNRAAEAAVPRARPIFLNAIEQMTLDDARAILNGPKDAATQYFQGKMSGPLAAEMRPIVESTLAEVGAIQSYDRMIGQYGQMPFMPDVKADLTSHVLDRAIAGVFLYLGREEAAIRENPARRTSEILKKVFGG